MTYTNILHRTRLRFPHAKINGYPIILDLEPNGRIHLSTGFTRIKFHHHIHHLFHSALADHVLKNSPLRKRHVRPYSRKTS